MTSCIVASLDQFSRGCQDPANVHVHILFKREDYCLGQDDDWACYPCLVSYHLWKEMFLRVGKKKSPGKKKSVHVEMIFPLFLLSSIFKTEYKVQNTKYKIQNTKCKKNRTCKWKWYFLPSSGSIYMTDCQGPSAPNTKMKHKLSMKPVFRAVIKQAQYHPSSVIRTEE